MPRFWAAILQKVFQTETKIKFWFIFLILFSVNAWGQARARAVMQFSKAQFGVRILTFSGNNPWQASETVYLRQDDGSFLLSNSTSLFAFGDPNCSDILRDNQQYTLDVMLAEKIITPEVHSALSDTMNRAHDRRQYILASAFVDMGRESAAHYNPARVRSLDNLRRARVSMGTLFVIRGYMPETNGVQPRDLPFQVADLSPGLSHPLKRDKIPVAIEFGRALNDNDSPPDTFRVLIQFLTTVVDADLRLLKVDPRTVPVFAHAYRSELANYFSKIMSGARLNVERQAALENDPQGFLRHVPTDPPGGPDDAVVVTSFATMVDKYYTDQFSGLSQSLSELLPRMTPLSLRQDLARELVTSVRENYDLEHSPVHVRDFETPFFDLKIAQIFKNYGFTLASEKRKRLYELMKEANTSSDLDSDTWIDPKLYIPQSRPFSSKPLMPTITISNLKKDFPDDRARDLYANHLILPTAAWIDKNLESLSLPELQFVFEETQLERRRRGLPLIPPPLTLAHFIESFEVLLATDDPRLADAIERAGVESGIGFGMHLPHTSGPMKLTIDETDPGSAKLLEILKRYEGKEGEHNGTEAEKWELLKAMAGFSRVFRLKIGAVEQAEQRLKNAPTSGPRGFVTNPLRDQLFRRQFITYF